MLGPTQSLLSLAHAMSQQVICQTPVLLCVRIKSESHSVWFVCGVLFTYINSRKKGMLYGIQITRRLSRVWIALMFQFLWMIIGWDLGCELTTFFTIAQMNIVHIIPSPIAERSGTTPSGDLREHVSV